MSNFYNELRRITKKLDELDKKAEARKQRELAKGRGYSSKCSICNHPEVNKIEELRAKGYTYEEIKDQLNLDCSIMALSRHFNNHYPKKERYQLQQQKVLLENAVTIIEKYPYLQDYFKDKDLSYIDEFTNTNGFCTDRLTLCPYVPANKVSNSKEIQEEYNNKMAAIYGRFNQDKNFIYLWDKCNCLDCNNKALTNRLELLELLLVREVYGYNLETNELYIT